jgi:hypothetical protein
MSNNKSHKANYTLKTVTGKVGGLGFRKTSGDTNTLASRGAKLIRTPLNTPLNTRYNSLVNSFIEVGNEGGIKLLEDIKLK